MVLVCSHMQRVNDCRCISQNCKEPFIFVLGTQVFIGRHIRSRSLAWLFYGPNFAGFLLRFLFKYQGGTNMWLFSRSFIVQFLSLQSAWLSSHSVLLISETFLGPESCPCLAENFHMGVHVIVMSQILLERKLFKALNQENASFAILLTCLSLISNSLQMVKPWIGCKRNCLLP